MGTGVPWRGAAWSGRGRPRPPEDRRSGERRPLFFLSPPPPPPPCSLCSRAAHNPQNPTPRPAPRRPQHRIAMPPRRGGVEVWVGLRQTRARARGRGPPISAGRATRPCPPALPALTPPPALAASLPLAHPSGGTAPTAPSARPSGRPAGPHHPASPPCKTVGRGGVCTGTEQEGPPVPQIDGGVIFFALGRGRGRGGAGSNFFSPSLKPLPAPEISPPCPPRRRACFPPLAPQDPPKRPTPECQFTHQNPFSPPPLSLSF